MTEPLLVTKEGDDGPELESVGNVCPNIASDPLAVAGLATRRVTLPFATTLAIVEEVAVGT